MKQPQWVAQNPAALHECIFCGKATPQGSKEKYTLEMEHGPALPAHRGCMGTKTGAEAVAAYKQAVYRLFGLRIGD